jgi:uncharacterized phage-associated protein
MRAIDAANFLVALSNSRDQNIDDGVSDMKLQKLLYFAQEASLRRRGRKLFDEDIEAWQYGPVIPAVYHEFKTFGRDPITIKRKLEDIAAGMSADDIELLANVYDKLSDRTASGLMEMTHRRGTPWSQAYDPRVDHVIPVSSIRAYTGDDQLWDSTPSWMMPTVNPPMKDGKYTWPEEWNDD